MLSGASSPHPYSCSHLQGAVLTYESRDHPTPVDVVCLAVCPGVSAGRSQRRASRVGPFARADLQATDQRSASSGLDREFQAAVAQYDSGQYRAGRDPPGTIVRQVPESFEVHELLGLVYSAQSQDAKANPHLEKAVRLKPDSAAARTNLAANLMRLGKHDLAEMQFRKAVEIEPRNFDANHNLGESYVRSGQLAKAAPLSRTGPADRSFILRQRLRFGAGLRSYRAAGGCAATGPGTPETEKHCGTAQPAGRDRGKRRKLRSAANEYEAAAHADPSESNLFDWGSELLLHRTLGPAVEVFQHASERYPQVSPADDRPRYGLVCARQL